MPPIGYGRPAETAFNKTPCGRRRVSCGANASCPRDISPESIEHVNKLRCHRGVRAKKQFIEARCAGEPQLPIGHDGDLLVVSKASVRSAGPRINAVGAVASHPPCYGFRKCERARSAKISESPPSSDALDANSSSGLGK